MERKDSFAKWGGGLNIEYNLECVTFQVSESIQRKSLLGEMMQVWCVAQGKVWAGFVSHQYIDNWNQRIKEVIYEKNKKWEDRLHEYLTQAT